MSAAAERTLPPHVLPFFEDLRDRGLLGPRAWEILEECIGWTPDDLATDDGHDLGGES